MTTTRRAFLQSAAVGTFGVLTASAMRSAWGDSIAQAPEAFKGSDIFEQILKKALAEKWETLPIGQTMGRIAKELEGTPYVAFTLELDKDKEFCSVNLTGLDCVTFFE